MLRSGRWLLGSGAIALATILAPRRVSAEPLRYPADQRDVETLRTEHPRALELLEQGEKLLQAGSSQEAAEVLAHASFEAPQSPIIARRHCQALTALDRHDDAVEACKRAATLHGFGGSAMDDRALVAALMSPNHVPMPYDVAQAGRYAKGARNAMPTQPFGHAATCNIAERIGDLDLLDRCVKELRRMAPDNEETRYYSAVLERARFSWSAALAWATIVTASLATAAHAAIRWSRQRARLTAAAAAFLLAFLTVGSVKAVEKQKQVDPTADRTSDWVIVDSDPESKLPTPKERDEDPVEFGQYLVDMSWKAEQAAKKGDHHAAVKYFRALVKLVPDEAVGYRKTCAEYEVLDDWKMALDYCRSALGQNGVTVGDYQAFVRLQLAKTTALAPSEVEDINAIVEHLRHDKTTLVAASQIQCELGLKVKSTAYLTDCTEFLASKLPDDPKTVSYQWALALERHDIAGAQRFLDRAKALSFPPEGIAKMERAMNEAEEPFWPRLLRNRLVVGLLSGGLGVAIFIFFTLRRRSAAPATPA
jgi:tetratricopeptide (TPR) repeat protein